MIALVNGGSIEAVGHAGGACCRKCPLYRTHLERAHRIPRQRQTKEETIMLEILKKFFRFCDKRERREFYRLDRTRRCGGFVFLR